MIEDYINNFDLEFPACEAIPKSDFVYYRRKGILKKMVEVANSYKNTPPCPSQSEEFIHPILKDMKREEVIPCATLRYQLSKSRLRGIKR